MNPQEQQVDDYPLHGYTPPVPFQSNIDNGIYEKFVDNNELIDEITLALQGKIKNDVTNQIETKGRPIMSEKAISWFIGRILAYTSKIFSLSHLDDRKISLMVFDFAKSVIGDLTFPEDVGVERQNRDMVFLLLIQTFEASINKAKDGITMKRLLEQHHIQETTIRQEKDKQNLFKRFGGLKI